MTVTRAAPMSENNLLVARAVSCTRLAVGDDDDVGLLGTETRTKRSRIRRSFSLFSAPPIGTIQPRLWPSGTLLGIRD